MPKALLDTTAYVGLQRARRHLDAPWAVNTLRNLELDVRTVGRPCLSMLTVAGIARGIEHELSQERLDNWRE